MYAFLQELLQVFETLDHQSYMLERYRDTKDQTVEEKNTYKASNLLGSTKSDNSGAGHHSSIEKLSGKEMKKIIEEDEEESDEDLSYLL